MSSVMSAVARKAGRELRWYKPCPVFAGIPAKSNPSLSCHLGPVRSVQQVDPARGILISDWVFWDYLHHRSMILFKRRN